MAATTSSSISAGFKEDLPSHEASQTPNHSPVPISKTKSPLYVDTHSANTSCRSVKSIVAWIESSAAGSRASFASIPSQKSGISTFTNQSSTIERVIPIMPLRPGAEEETLNFLAYRNYFTDTSLLRCLDGYPESCSAICDMTNTNRTCSHKPSTAPKANETSWKISHIENGGIDGTRTKEEAAAF